jgi:histidine triad (HIT) family protein
MDCIFCQIAAGKVSADILYQDNELVAFRDINPQAPLHVLIIPRRHITSLSELSDDEATLVGRMAVMAKQVARAEAVFERGYRLVINCGKEGGQAVPHLHLHLLGARKLSGKLG